MLSESCVNVGLTPGLFYARSVTKNINDKMFLVTARWRGFNNKAGELLRTKNKKFVNLTFL